MSNDLAVTPAHISWFLNPGLYGSNNEYVSSPLTLDPIPTTEKKKKNTEVEGIGRLWIGDEGEIPISLDTIGRDAGPSLSSEGASSPMRKKNKIPFLHDELTSLFLLLFY